MTVLEVKGNLERWDRSEANEVSEKRVEKSKMPIVPNTVDKAEHDTDNAVEKVTNAHEDGKDCNLDH